MRFGFPPVPALALSLSLAACSGSGVGDFHNDGDATGGGADAGHDAQAALDGKGAAQDALPAIDLAMPAVDTVLSNRDRLLGTYYDFLKATAVQPQSNGLSGGNVTSVCDLWKKLDPSSQDVFLTLTARLQGSILGSDGSSMLWHIKKIYRISGGQGATANSPGSCGGGEYNRMIMSMDAALQASQLAANQHKGARQMNGKPDIADIPQSSTWRDSHDGAGPHAPFNLSDETSQGAPRGQTQYFSDPTSQLAHAPLGRLDLPSLVDPYAVEMDQDYDCPHNSNPDCTYVTYGSLCLPQAALKGTDVYTKSYGSFGAGYEPSDCGGK